MAEWSNAPDSKSGVQFLLYRGFESLLLRHRSVSGLPRKYRNTPESPALRGFFVSGRSLASIVHRGSAPTTAVPPFKGGGTHQGPFQLRLSLDLPGGGLSGQSVRCIVAPLASVGQCHVRYALRVKRFSLPAWRYFMRQYLPPAAVTSRYMPRRSARRACGLPGGQAARSHSILFRGVEAFLLGTSENADSCPQICPRLCPAVNGR